MTYSEIKQKLENAGIDCAADDTELLLQHFCKIPRHELLWRRNEDLDAPGLAEAVSRRAGREPLQYILGKWSFFGLEFNLNPDCLIPRPDTELTVELAIGNLPSGGCFLDIGTGSGAISVAVLHKRPDVTAVGMDISENALSAARSNADANGVGGRFTTLHGDALNPESFRELPRFDAVISNPPYIPTCDLSALEPELGFEPRRALDGGPDGLIFYRSITDTARCLLKPNGFLLYEIGIGEEDAVRKLGGGCGFICEEYRDLSGIVRALLLRPEQIPETGEAERN